MSRYIYPCIITEEQGYYIANFPDLDNREFFHKDLFDIFEEASNILLIELTLKETKREVPGASSDIKSFTLKENQFTSYIFCDTEPLIEELELMDNKIQIEELSAFLKEREKENKKKILEEFKKTEKENKKPIKHKGSLPATGVDDDIVFIDNSFELDKETAVTEEKKVPDSVNPKTKPIHNVERKNFNKISNQDS